MSSTTTQRGPSPSTDVEQPSHQAEDLRGWLNEASLRLYRARLARGAVRHRVPGVSRVR